MASVSCLKVYAVGLSQHWFSNCSFFCFFVVVVVVVVVVFCFLFFFLLQEWLRGSHALQAKDRSTCELHSTHLGCSLW